MTYVLIVLRRARRQTDYQPVLSDWLWYMVLPLVSYTTLVVAAIPLPGHSAPALFVIAAATMLLLSPPVHFEGKLPASGTEGELRREKFPACRCL